MAEHVAFQALERLDEGSLAMHRRVALVRVQRQPAFAHGRLDLSTLARRATSRCAISARAPSRPTT